MSETRFRPTLPGDLEAAAALWQEAFHDPADTVRRLLTEGGLLRCGMAAERDGRLLSMMFAFPGLEPGGQSAAYLYALCTRADCRGQGLGAGVLEALAERCFAEGAETVFLSPADAGLACWYETRFGLRELGGAADRAVTLTAGAAGRCEPIGVKEYLRVRGGVTEALLRAQNIWLEAAGGGLLRLTLSSGEAFACAAPASQGLRVLELLCPDAARDEALRTLGAHFSATRLLLRGAGRALPLLGRSRDGGAAALSEFCFPFIMD